MNKQNIYRSYILLLMGFLCTAGTYSQAQTVKYDLYELQEKNGFELVNRQLSVFSEEEAAGIRFSKNDYYGIAWLKDVEFSDGTIELDIRGRDVMQQSFVGIAFHGVDYETMDAIYFRPFNFRSEDPVRKIHAVQYISHPDHTWQFLRENHNGEYEKAVEPAPDGNEWFHVRIVVHYPTVSVYVNENTVPSLVINKLNERKSGKIGLWVGHSSDGDFANLQITK